MSTDYFTSIYFPFYLISTNTVRQGQKCVQIPILQKKKRTVPNVFTVCLKLPYFY